MFASLLGTRGKPEKLAFAHAARWQDFAQLQLAFRQSASLVEGKS